MYELALRAGITFIGVQSDDPVNLEDVLVFYTSDNVQGIRQFSATGNTMLGNMLWWTDNPDHCSPAIYEKFRKAERTLVFVNCPSHPLIFDAGMAPTPPQLLEEMLKEMVTEGDIPLVMPLLKGVSLKTAEDILRLTQARAGNMLPKEIRKTRMEIAGAIQGLYPADTHYDFYIPDAQLAAWLELNKKFFLTPNVHHKLVPRGLLLDGHPGVGKSMGSKYIANSLGVPLYRLDLATTLDKYIGVSESRIAKILQQVDREEPCVLLLDEVEKIFTQKEDSGVITRILSQLLWWLAEHRSRVMTIMTTNHREQLPPELYRSGRIDQVIKIQRMTFTEAKTFAQHVYKSVVGQVMDIKKLQQFGDTLGGLNQPDYSHAEVAELVYTEVKKNNWITV